MTLAMEDELFDRAHAFHMLPLFYPEAHRVFHQDFEAYLRYGGRIENGESIYESLDSFREADERVIADNFQHSISVQMPLGWYRGMKHAMETRQMPSYVEKALLRCNRVFMEQVVEEALASPSLTAEDETWRQYICSGIQTVFDAWKAQDDPYQVQETYDGLDDIRKCLAYLRVIRWRSSWFSGNEGIAFYQPGLRSCLSIEMLRKMQESEACQAGTPAQQKSLWGAVGQSIWENVLKEVIGLQMDSDSVLREQYEITNYIHPGPAFLVMKKGIYDAALMDIRATKTCQPESDGTEERMNDSEVCSHIERWCGGKIRGKIVLYLGEDTFCENGVCYLHAGDFLCHPQEKLQEAVRHYQQSGVSKESYDA